MASNTFNPREQPGAGAGARKRKADTDDLPSLPDASDFLLVPDSNDDAALLEHFASSHDQVPESRKRARTENAVSHRTPPPKESKAILPVAPPAPVKPRPAVIQKPVQIKPAGSKPKPTPQQLLSRHQLEVSQGLKLRDLVRKVDFDDIESEGILGSGTYGVVERAVIPVDVLRWVSHRLDFRTFEPLTCEPRSKQTHVHKGPPSRHQDFQVFQEHDAKERTAGLDSARDCCGSTWTCSTERNQRLIPRIHSSFVNASTRTLSTYSTSSELSPTCRTPSSLNTSISTWP